MHIFSERAFSLIFYSRTVCIFYICVLFSSFMVEIIAALVYQSITHHPQLIAFITLSSYSINLDDFSLEFLCFYVALTRLNVFTGTGTKCSYDIWYGIFCTVVFRHLGLLIVLQFLTSQKVYRSQMFCRPEFL